MSTRQSNNGTNHAGGRGSSSRGLAPMPASLFYSSSSKPAIASRLSGSNNENANHIALPRHSKAESSQSDAWRQPKAESSRDGSRHGLLGRPMGWADRQNPAKKRKLAHLDVNYDPREGTLPRSEASGSGSDRCHRDQEQKNLASRLHQHDQSSIRRVDSGHASARRPARTEEDSFMAALLQGLEHDASLFQDPLLPSDDESYPAGPDPARDLILDPDHDVRLAPIPFAPGHRELIPSSSTSSPAKGKSVLKAEVGAPELPDPQPFDSTKPSQIDKPAVKSSPDDYQFSEDFPDLEFLKNLDFDETELLSKIETESNPLYPILRPAVHPESSRGDCYRPIPYARCRVFKVTGLDAGASEGRSWMAGWPEKLVHVRMEGSRKGEIELLLKDEYASLNIAEGDILNIITPKLDDGISAEASSDLLKQFPNAASSPTSPPLRIEISMKSPDTHLIHHPDILLPMTTIAGGLNCRRKPLIQGLLRASRSASTKPLLYGNILHELLQTSLSQRCFQPSTMKRNLESILNSNSIQIEIWAAGLGLEEVRGEVWEKAQHSLVNFGTKWVGKSPSSLAKLHVSKEHLAITGLHDIEESIWSPKWGMKGKVDASVDVVSNETLLSEPRPMPMPFEIKTGRSVGVMEHRAQTMLYTLLMEERYKMPVGSGLLYYTQSDAMLKVNAAKHEIRSLLQARNEIAGYLARKRVSSDFVRLKQANQYAEPTIEELPVLPPTIDNYRECKNCYASSGCMLYRRAVDKVPQYEDDPLYDIFSSKAGHLDDADLDFFARWEQLITLEEQDMQRYKHQLWTMTAKERERTGRCFADMIITSHQDVRITSRSKIHQHSYTFKRQTNAGTPLLNGHIGKGDPVTISMFPNLISIARGFVVELSPDSVVIGTDAELELDALLERTQTDSGLFRIDKDEMLSGTARMRDNLARLFYNDEDDGDSRRRSLIVHLAEPEYEALWAPEPEEIPAHLNTDQAAAMRHVLTAKDYALILGMPGTGKTTTIAEIILALVRRGKSVLLTSYTHSAVDTILMKLVNSGEGILRLGNADKVHPDVAHFTLDAKAENRTLSELDAMLMQPQIVATTCLSIDQRFDYCIVDEASQITLPTCVGPLRFADTFVLVGDHFQLPPIVRNPEAMKGGLDISLFRLLTEAHPQAVVELRQQYRMNEEIMSISNRLIYGGRLRCGSEEVATQAMQYSVFPQGPAWLREVCRPELKVVFLDTDRISGRESRLGDLVQNKVEAGLVRKLAFAMIDAGIPQENIGIITPYRQQIKLISSLVHAQYPALEVLTADKSQGRDKDCILISMVRSNDTQNVGDLLKDWRRINVSFTRAKQKLVVIGSRTTLVSDRLLSEFFELADEKKWVYQLAPGSEWDEETVEAKVSQQVRDSQQAAHEAKKS